MQDKYGIQLNLKQTIRKWCQHWMLSIQMFVYLLHHLLMNLNFYMLANKPKTLSLVTEFVEATNKYKILFYFSHRHNCLTRDNDDHMWIHIFSTFCNVLIELAYLLNIGCNISMIFLFFLFFNIFLLLLSILQSFSCY